MAKASDIWTPLNSDAFCCRVCISLFRLISVCDFRNRRRENQRKINRRSSKWRGLHDSKEISSQTRKEASLMETWWEYGGRWLCLPFLVFATQRSELPILKHLFALLNSLKVSLWIMSICQFLKGCVYRPHRHSPTLVFRYTSIVQCFKKKCFKSVI